MYKNATKKHTYDYDFSEDIAKICDALSDTAKDVKGKASEVLSQSLENMKDKSVNIKENVEAYISEKPYTSLLLAMISGMLIGGALSRPKKCASSCRGEYK